MSSRDIWIKGGTPKARDLVAMLLSARLLCHPADTPLYLASPYLSDFPLFANQQGQFCHLFRHQQDTAGRAEINFSDALIELACESPVRVLTVFGRDSEPFVEKLLGARTKHMSVRMLDDPYHAKGLASPDFYLEGSMNFTYMGLCWRDEKITINSRDSELGRRKIDNALLELGRLWRVRAESERGAVHT